MVGVGGLVGWQGRMMVRGGRWLCYGRVGCWVVGWIGGWSGDGRVDRWVVRALGRDGVVKWDRFWPLRRQ